MHVKSLKVFCDVVAQRSFSRAADENGISQSGASQIVAQLEQRLGVKLIDRSKRPFVLTREGAAYYEGCRPLVQRYYALEEDVRTLNQEVGGRVAVASIYSIGLSHMNRFIRNFLAEYPKADVRLQYQHPTKVYDFVETDQVDLGLVSYPRPSRTIAVIAWREEPMVLVCAPDHPFSRRRSVALAELDGLDMVGFDDDLHIRHELDRVLSSHGVRANVVMAFDNIETIKGAIEINAGVGLLPEPTVRRELASGSLSAVPLRGEAMNRPLGIIHRRGKEFGRTARRFMERLQDEKHAADPVEGDTGP